MTASPALIGRSSPGRCTACEGELAFFGRRDAYAYARCRACSTIQLSPFPSEVELQRAYEEDYATSGHYGTDPDAIFRASLPFYSAALHGLRRSGVGQGKILDLGCGWGGMCKCLRDAGYEYLGIDYHSQSLGYCKRQGLNVSDVRLDQLAVAEERFSAVLMITVFEHLHDHAGTVTAIRKILEPRGLLLILIPTAGVFGWVAGMVQRFTGTEDIPAVNTTFCPPWHTVIFSVRGLDRLLTRNGFEQVDVRPAPSGAGEGLLGLAQRTATTVANAGFAAFGTRWPIVLNHLFTYRVR